MKRRTMEVLKALEQKNSNYENELFEVTEAYDTLHTEMKSLQSQLVLSQGEKEKTEVEAAEGRDQLTQELISKEEEVNEARDKIVKLEATLKELQDRRRESLISFHSDASSDEEDDEEDEEGWTGSIGKLFGFAEEEGEEDNTKRRKRHIHKEDLESSDSEGETDYSEDEDDAQISPFVENMLDKHVTSNT